MKLARPSIAESSPKPTSAIEPAMIPAATATEPSMQSQARLIQARSLASRASRSHSAERAASGALRPISTVLIDSNLDKSTHVDTFTHVDMRWW